MDPVLQEFLRSRQWERAFSEASMKAGLGLVFWDAVPAGYEIDDQGNRLIVRGLVHGEMKRHSFQAEVVAEKDANLGRVTMRSSCSCGVKFFCDHRFALIFTATEKLESSGWKVERVAIPSVRAWLDELAKITNAEAAESPDTPRIYYCLYHHFAHGPVICPRQGLLNAEGLPEGEWKPIDLRNIANRGGLRQQDAGIAGALSHMEVHTLSGPPATIAYELSGLGSGELLRKLLDSGRLFHVSQSKDPQPRPIVAGAPVQLVLGWDEDGEGNVTPVIVTEHRGLLPMLLDTPWCLDESNAVLHPVAGKVTPGLHAIWLQGPNMGAEEAAHVASALAAMPVPLPKPEAEHLEHVRPESFTPMLRFIRVRTEDVPGREIPRGGVVLAVPFFRYGTDWDFAPLGPKDDPLGKMHTKEKLFIIHRLKDAEKAALNSLEEFGLRPPERGYGGFGSHKQLCDAVYPEGAILHDPLAWLVWRNTGEVERLLERGWQLEEVVDQNVRVVEVPQGRVCLEPFEKDGIDWFSFDLGVEVDGEHVSILPALAAAMESHGDALLAMEAGDDEMLEMPLDDAGERILKFPLKRFIGMARHVVELFGAVPRPGARLHPMQAAELASRDGEEIVGPDPDETWRLRKLGESLRARDSRARITVPGSLQVRLRPYQEEGFQWLQFLARHDLNGILADDMGLGKTLQTITHITAEKEQDYNKGLPTLVIAPTSVTGNWVNEIQRFAPHLRVMHLRGAGRRHYFESMDAADVVVTSYALLQKDEDELIAQKFHLVVLDEAQYIKNPGTKAAQAACKLNSNHRLALSGTPMENHLGELWSLMRFLMPGLLGSAEEFRRIYRTPIERQTDVNRQRLLNRKVGPLILRRTKDLVAKDLPPKTEMTQLIDLHSAQADLYESVRAALDARVSAAIAERGLKNSQLVVLDAMLKLRQICCHPGLLETSEAAAAGSAKLDYLMDLLGSLGESGRRALVFSQFTSMLARIEDRLEDEGIRYLKLTGSTQNRAELVREFQEGDAPVFLISLKAGGTGLNLTAADTVIHFDPWWNPAVESQASDRAHRIGQTKPVFIHRLICRGTIEERIQELQAKKAGLVDALLSGSTEAFRLDAETIRELMSPLQER